MKLLNIALILTSLAFTSSAAPTEPSAPAHDVAPTFPAPRSAPPLGNYCGKALITGLGQQGELRTSEPWNKCNTLDQGLSYGLGMNPYCGLCVMFKYVTAVMICVRLPLT